MNTAIVWFRRDLRIADHPALHAALERHERVVPVFLLDDRLLHGRFASGNRTQFMLECLGDLDAALRERGARLVVRRERPERALPRLAAETGARAVHVTRDVTPFARARGLKVADSLARAGVELHAHAGVNVVDDATVPRTKSGGRPYRVFAAFERAWAGLPRREVLEAPARLEPCDGVDPGAIPSLRELGLEVEADAPARGGEREAGAALERFLAGPVRRYADNHDALGEDGTSRLSPYIHFGAISPRLIESRLPAGAGPDAFRRQLCWRDFYHHVIYHHPGNAREELQERYRGTRYHRAADDAEHEAFTAWCDGRTGYPLVDAGMRQLRREGWMHNRARLVVGSFLTKDLGIDWRRGEQWFMRMLIDGDEANNNGNWQWIASVGTDPQPYFRRVYNPALQRERHDPRGAYVRRYVPELSEVPERYLSEPWTMPEEVQRAVGCMVGEDYPEPIVDHGEARREALARYRSAVAPAQSSV